MSTVSQYWETRGRQGYLYRGEVFYTVTPVPLYYRRRQLLLQLMEPIVGDPACKSICDFGCGDGFYLRHFSSRYPGKQWCGVDVARSMIEQARSACAIAEYHVSGTGIPAGRQFDLIYAIAVFAHVMDDGLLERIARSVSEALKPDGHFVLFEQTGHAAGGETWRRRPSSEYVSLMERHGLVVGVRQLLAFPVHRAFERTLASWYYRIFTSGPDRQSRCIGANRSPVFRAMSHLALCFDRTPLRADDGATAGNTLYVFSKKAAV